MKLFINGKKHTIDRDLTLDELLRLLDHNIQNGGIAIAVNDEVVTKQQWQEHRLADGDHIEIIHATQGG